MDTLPTTNDADGALTGWPVGSFPTEAAANEMAAHLYSTHDLAPGALNIVGYDPVRVTRVIGRITIGRLLISATIQALVIGALVGVFLSLATGEITKTVLSSVIMATIFGILIGLLPKLRSNSPKLLTTVSFVCSRYDILCDPAVAPAVRDTVAARLAETAPPRLGAGFGRH